MSANNATGNGGSI
jgi:hypothetical protein